MSASRILVFSICFSISIFCAPKLSWSMSPSEVFKKVSPSVVIIRSTEVELDTNSLSGSQGSGVVIGQGTVITNFHVIANAPCITVKYKKKKYKATLIYADKIRDLAQLSVPDLKAPSIGRRSYKKIGIGDTVFAVGAPKGLDLTLSQGLISSIREEQDSVLIQTSAAISNGSSGGGLFDDEGRLVGITTAMVKDGQNLNFAVPVDWIDDLKKRTLVSSPEEAKLLLMSGLYSQKKDLDKLVEVTTKWLEIAPHNWYAQVTKGDACYQLKLSDTAIDLYSKVARCTVSGSEPFVIASSKGLGEAYLLLHRYNAAIKSYKKFLTNFKKHAGDSPKPMQLILIANANEMMAACYEKLGLYDKAIDCHEKVEKLISISPAPALNIGRLFRKKGEYEKSLVAMKRSKEKAPAINASQIDFEMGKTRMAMGKLDDAIFDFKLASSNRVLGGFANAELGNCYLLQKQYDEALEAYEAAVKTNPDDVEFYGPLGKLYLKKKEYSKAATALEKFSFLAGNDQKLLSRLAKAQMKAKQYEEATRSYEKCTGLHGSTVKDWYYLALLYSFRQQNLWVSSGSGNFPSA